MQRDAGRERRGDCGAGAAGKVVVSSDSGTVLFLPDMWRQSRALYAGDGTTGPVYRYAFSAVSDEWLLDKAVGSAGERVGLAQPARVLLQTLTNEVDAGDYLQRREWRMGLRLRCSEPSQTSEKLVDERRRSCRPRRSYVVSRAEWGVDAAARGNRNSCLEHDSDGTMQGGGVEAGSGKRAGK